MYRMFARKSVSALCVTALVLEVVLSSIFVDASFARGKTSTGVALSGASVSQVQSGALTKREAKLARGLSQAGGVESSVSARMKSLGKRIPGELSDAKVRWNASSDRPLGIAGMKKKTTDPVMDTQDILDGLRPLYGISGGEKIELSKTRERTDKKTGQRHTRMKQSYRGIPVIGGEMIAHTNKQGQLYAIDSNYYGGIAVDTTPQVSAKSVLDAKLATLAGKKDLKVEKKPRLVIYPSGANYLLAWELRLSHLGDRGAPVEPVYYVDAHTGKDINSYDTIRNIETPTASGTLVTLSGSRLTREDGTVVTLTGWLETGNGKYYLSNPSLKYSVRNNSTNTGVYSDAAGHAYRDVSDWGTSDPSEISVARNMELTLSYYQSLFGFSVSSLSGMTDLPVNVHYGTNYANAYWDGESMTFGDGDGASFGSLTTLDILAHEFWHAWTEHTSDLVYQSEPGALNESFSDISAVNIEFYAQENDAASYPDAHAGKADWLIGEDATIGTTALRDMRDPANTAVVGVGGEQPTRYHGTYWYYGSGDNGGVHYNSSVQNLFYYLLSEGGSGNNDGISYSFSGISLNNARQVAYEVNTHHIVSTETYMTARQKWIDAANVLDPTGAWAIVVGKAWDAVGVFEIPEVPLSVSEDFETWTGSGAMSDGWSVSGTGAWFPDTSTGAYGSQSVRSPVLGNSQYSVLTWSGNIAANGFVTFFTKVSSEAGYDGLIFYVDGDRYATWSGEVPWKFVYYYLPAGDHTLEWVYIKDSMLSSWSDAAWIDGLNLPTLPHGSIDLVVDDSLLLVTGSTNYAYTNRKTQAILLDNAGTVDYTLSGTGIVASYTGTLIHSGALHGTGSVAITLSDGDGEKAMEVYYTDAFANTGAGFWTYRPYLDTTGPAIGNIVFPVAGTSYATGTISATWDVATDDGVGMGSGSYEYTLFGDNEIVMTGSTSGTGVLIEGLTDGNYNLSVRAFDLLGNQPSSWPSHDFTVDMTAPTISAYPSNIHTNTGVVDISITPSEPVDYMISGQGIMGTYTGVLSSTGVALVRGALTLGDGVKDFSVQLTDRAGNTSDIYTGSFLLDATAPTAPTNLVINGGVYIGTGVQSSVTLVGSGEASESGATVNYFISEWDGTGSVSGTGVVNSDGSFTILGIDVSSLMDGLIGVWVSFTDLFGNQGSESSISIAKSTVNITGGISFLSGSAISTWNTSLSIRSNKSVDYVISGSDLIASLTGSISGSGSNVESLSFTGVDGIKTITAELTDSVGATGSVSASVLVDTTGSVVSVASHASGALVTDTSVTLTGSISDLAGLSSLQIVGSGVTVASGSWSQTVSLVGWDNAITLTATDLLGNSSSTVWNIRRIATTSAVNANVESLTGARITFVSNLSGTGVVLYGTDSGSLNAGMTESSAGTSHTMILDTLASDTLYYYRVYATVGGYDGSYSAIKSFRTPRVVDTSAPIAQSLTGTVSLSGASATGVVFGNNTGSLAIKSLDGASTISFPLTGLAISSSGTWDGIIAAPEVRDLTGSVSVGTGFAAVGPVYKIGSESSSLVFSGQSVSVSLAVSSSYNGTNLTIYRSDDSGNSFSSIGSCTVAQGMCTFSTNHFSLFAFGEPTDTTPEAFSIASRTGAELGIESTSASFTLTGYNAPTTISITGGTYSIGVGAFTSASGTLAVGESIRVKLNSSASYATTTTLTLTVGGVGGTYSVTTKSQSVSSGGGWGGGGGGGSSASVKDTCPNGDYSASLYDGSCGTKPVTSTGTSSTGSVVVTTTAKSTGSTVAAAPAFSFASPLISGSTLSEEAKVYIQTTLADPIEKKLEAKVKNNTVLKAKYYAALEKYFYQKQLSTKYVKEKQVYKYLRNEFRKKKSTR